MQVEAAVKAFEENLRVIAVTKSTCKDKNADDFEIIRDDLKWEAGMLSIGNYSLKRSHKKI